MIKSVANTILSRIVVILFSFAVVWMNTNNIGATGQGDVALIVLGILLIVSINNFMGGGAIVYLTSRVDPRGLFAPCFLWTLVSVGLFAAASLFYPIVPEEYFQHVLILGFLQSLFVFHQQIALGRNRVWQFNALTICQWFMTAGSLAYFYFAKGELMTFSFVKALYISFGTTFILGIILTGKEWIKFDLRLFKKATQEIWRYGFYSQTGNIFQLLAYRLAFVFLDQLYKSREAVGIFSVGMQLNEAAMMPAKSMGMVQYAKLSNSDDPSYNLNLSVNLMKFALAITILIAGVVVVLPESFYLWVFGNEMIGLKIILTLLAPGMGALAISSITAHHFSGVGLHKHNSIGSLVTLATLVGLGIFIIPEQGIKGAAWVSAATYIVQAIYLFTVFVVTQKPSTRQILSLKIDWQLLRD